MVVTLPNGMYIDTTVKCMNCNVLIVRKSPCFLIGAKYCNRECYANHRRSDRVPRTSPYHRIPRSLFINTISRAFMFDDCGICGWNETSCDLAHIVPLKDGGLDILENTVILCPNHHRMFDRGMIDLDIILEARDRCYILNAVSCQGLLDQHINVEDALPSVPIQHINAGDVQCITIPFELPQATKPWTTPQ